MPDVQVTASNGAAPTTTDENGKFTLEFPDKSPGEKVRLIVLETGHVVVNDVQLCWTLPKDPDTEPLILLLCREDAREEMARQFYRLKSSEAIEARYQQRLTALQEGQQVTAAELARLREERDQAKAIAERISEELARLQPGRVAHVYQEAMRLFLVGRVTDAITLLDPERLQQSGEAAKRQKAMAGRDIADVIQAWLFRGSLLSTQFRFDEAKEAYEQAIAMGPEDFGAFHAYAIFCHGLNRYSDALPAYLRCRDIAKRSGNRADLAMATNNLGTLYYDQNRLQDAHQTYQEALTVYSELVKADPRKYLRAEAGVLGNLGTLYQDQNQAEDAHRAHSKALAIQRYLAAADYAAYSPDVATTLNNLAILYRSQNRMEETAQAYEEARETYHQLARANPAAYLPDEAQTLSNFSALYMQQKRKDEARRVVEEALMIQCRLAERNPEAYLPDMASTLNNLGILHRMQNELEKACQAYEKARDIYRQLAETHPEAYWDKEAKLLHNLGNLYRDQGRMEEACQTYEKARTNHRLLAEANPMVCSPAEARLLVDLGDFYHSQKQIEKARQAYGEALKIYARWARQNREVYGSGVMAEIIIKLLAVSREQNRPDEAQHEGSH